MQMLMIAYPLFIGMWELIIILCLILLLFGGKKIPELMRGLGKGVNSFKKGLHEVEEQVRQDAAAPEAGSDASGETSGQK